MTGHGVGEADVDQLGWAALVTRLTAYVSTMEDGDRLVLHPPGTCGSETIIEAAGGGTTYLVAEPDDVREWDLTAVAVTARPAGLLDSVSALVSGLRSRERLLHPSLLTVSATGASACGLGVLRLTHHDDVDLDEVRAPRRPSPVGRVRWPENQADLMQLTLEHVRSRCGEIVVLGPEREIELAVDGVSFVIRPVDGRPVLRLGALCVDDVRLRMAADLELNILNRHHCSSRWVRRGREVWQELTLYARPFCPGVLDRMIDEFVEDWHATHDDLTDRVGGRHP